MSQTTFPDIQIPLLFAHCWICPNKQDVTMLIAFWKDPERSGYLVIYKINSSVSSMQMCMLFPLWQLKHMSVVWPLWIFRAYRKTHRRNLVTNCEHTQQCSIPVVQVSPVSNAIWDCSCLWDFHCIGVGNEYHRHRGLLCAAGINYHSFKFQTPNSLGIWNCKNSFSPVSMQHITCLEKSQHM